MSIKPEGIEDMEYNDSTVILTNIIREQLSNNMCDIIDLLIELRMKDKVTDLEEIVEYY